MSEEDDVVDFSVDFDVLDNFPCCPLCDNAMEQWEPVLIIKANGDVALAHTACIAERRQELGI